MSTGPQVSTAAPGTGASREARWPAVAGIAFAVLFVIGLVLGASTPEYDASDREWVRWFDDSSNRMPQIVSLFALALAAVVFVVFVAGLVRRLRARGGDDFAPVVVLGGGLLVAGFTMVAGIAMNQVSAAIEFAGDYPIPNADVLRQSEQLGFGVGLLGVGFAAALTVAATSIAARASGALPGWLVVAGYVAAVLLLASVAFIPLALLPVWVLAVSIVMLRRPTVA